MHGVPCMQVMTGVVTEDDLEAARQRPGFQEPDYRMRSFGDLLVVREQLLQLAGAR